MTYPLDINAASNLMEDLRETLKTHALAGLTVKIAGNRNHSYAQSEDYAEAFRVLHSAKEILDATEQLNLGELIEFVEKLESDDMELSFIGGESDTDLPDL